MNAFGYYLMLLLAELSKTHKYQCQQLLTCWKFALHRRPSF